MMPIFFPFTYISKRVAQALATIFQRYIVYQPTGKKVPDTMQSWIDAKVMEVRVPGQADDDAIDKVVKDFRFFAGLHYNSKNLKTAALLGKGGAFPSINETSTSRIVSDLKKAGSPDSAQTGSDPLFGARVFLGLAQDFDRKADELNHDIDVHTQQSFELLKTLRGETEIDPAVIEFGTGSKTDDPGEYMALARLQAWTRLYQNDPVGSGLFVTSSKMVFNEVLAELPATEKILQSAELPAAAINDSHFHSWRIYFLKQLDKLVQTQWSDSKDAGVDFPLKDAGGPSGALTLHLLPDQTPGDVFAQYLKAWHSPSKQPDQRLKFKNTLVGLVECQP